MNDSPIQARFDAAAAILRLIWLARRNSGQDSRIYRREQTALHARSTSNDAKTGIVESARALPEHLEASARPDRTAVWSGEGNARQDLQEVEDSAAAAW